MKNLIYKIIIPVICSTLITQAVHEWGHASVLLLNGNGPTWNLNSLAQLWGKTPLESSNWYSYISDTGESGWLRVDSFPKDSKTEFMMILMGPICSLFLALCTVVFLNLESLKQLIFTFISILSPFIYYIRGPFRDYGDEYLIAKYLGIPKMGLDIFMLIFYTLLLLIFILKMKHLSFRLSKSLWLLLIIYMVITGIGIMSLNDIFINQINAENPLFKPVFGISFPVFTINITSVIVLINYRTLQSRGRR